MNLQAQSAGGLSPGIVINKKAPALLPQTRTAGRTSHQLAEAGLRHRQIRPLLFTVLSQGGDAERSG